MKTIVAFLIIALASQFASAGLKIGQKPHLDLNTTSKEYRLLLFQQSFTGISADSGSAEDIALNRWLAIGQRNLQWVDLVNKHRPPENKISLSSPATQGGIPVSSPSSYNYQIIKDKCDIVEALLPKALKSVIYEGSPLTETVPVTDRQFIEWLAQIDKCYQSTARYKLMKPWTEELKQEAVNDVRGYLRMKNDPLYDQKLNQWNSQSQSQKNQMLLDLSQICWNSGVSKAACEKELAVAATSSRGLLGFKGKYQPTAKTHYEEYFQIQKTRTDVTWNSSNPNLTEIPFANPHNAVVEEYLRFNIEQEWKWEGWQLKLKFIETTSPDTTHVVFEAGSTPHVNGLAGSEITMDANAPLSEYDVQWTIRHEYGHVLGFADCYLEFYDEALEAFVNYQLDVTDLMRSRRGMLKKSHFDEMKRAYYKQ